MKMEEFEVSSVVRGCHIYKETWTPFAHNSVLHAILGYEREVIIGLYAQQNIGGFRFGDIGANRQVTKLNVLPIFWRLL